MIWEQLLAILGGAGILVSALAYLVKTLFTYWIDKDIERFKSDLKAESSIAVEKLRMELFRELIEHEVKYRRNDEEVANRLNNIYKHLLAFHESVCDYVRILELSNEPPKEDKLKIASNASKAFWKDFLENRLYVPKSIFDNTNDFAKKLTRLTNDFTENLQAENHENEVSEPGFWYETYKKLMATKP